jgi:predicted Zn-dependent peptidase
MRFEKHKTDSGIPLYYMNIPWANTVSCGVLVRAGTVDEVLPQEAGLAHALEHMRFQGTRSFPNSSSISSYIEDVGGIINAWTSHLGTFYYQRVLADEFERCPRLLSEMSLYPLFPEDKIGTEMDNIVQEIRMKNDNPHTFISKKYGSHMYNDHPMSRSVLGIEESVKDFTRDSFVSFTDRLYHNINFTFIVVGNVESDRVVESFNRYFAESNRGALNFRPTMSLEGVRHKNRRFFYGREIEQVHMVMGYLLGSEKDRSTNILELYSAMISGGMSFPLFQEVRDKMGLCYSIGSSMNVGPDVSDFNIEIGTDPDKYSRAESAILKVIDENKTNRDLLNKTKMLLRGRIALIKENFNSIMFGAAIDTLVCGKPKDSDDELAVIESITIEEVEDAVNRYLSPDKMLNVMVGPKRLEPKI